MALPTQLFSRCPACLDNFIAIFCYMSCDPNQADFLHGKKTEPQGLDPNLKSWKEIDYYVSEDFAYGTFNSCRSVQNPSTGGTALEITCGRSIDECTPPNWLKYMGDPSQNPKAPFTINFHISNSTKIKPEPNVTITPMDAPTKPCNETCSCQDCRAACGPPPPSCPDPQPSQILWVDGYSFIAASELAAFIILVGIWQICTYICCYPDEDVTGSADSSINGEGGAASQPRDGYTVRIEPGDVTCCEKVRFYFV